MLSVSGVNYGTECQAGRTEFFKRYRVPRALEWGLAIVVVGIPTISVYVFLGLRMRGIDFYYSYVFPHVDMRWESIAWTLYRALTEWWPISMVVFFSTLTLHRIIVGKIKYARVVARFGAQLPSNNGKWCVTLTPDAMIAEQRGIRRIAQWRCTTELAWFRGNWVLMTYDYAEYVSRSDFPDRATERAFVREALRHMPEQARRRSRKAMAFASKGPAKVSPDGVFRVCGPADPNIDSLEDAFERRHRVPRWFTWGAIGGLIIPAYFLGYYAWSCIPFDWYWSRNFELTTWRPHWLWIVAKAIFHVLSSGWLGGAVLSIVTADILGRIERRWARRIRARYAYSAKPSPSRWTASIISDGFVYEEEGVRKVISWPCVTEIVPSADCWVVLVHLWPYFFPKAIFGDPAGERAFLRGLLDHMTESARARSPQAVKFAETGAL